MFYHPKMYISKLLQKIFLFCLVWHFSLSQEFKEVSSSNEASAFYTGMSNFFELKGEVFFFSSTNSNSYNHQLYDASENLLKISANQDDATLIKEDLSTVYQHAFLKSKQYFISSKSRYDQLTLSVTDGTTAGTQKIIELSGESVSNFVSTSSYLYFFVEKREYINWQTVYTRILYKSDGTASGTSVVKIFNDRILHIKAHNESIFFVATDGVHGYELWTSNGTQAGTFMVKDIYEGTYGSFEEYSASDPFTQFNGSLYFTCRRGWYTQAELWKTDGTSEGTIPIKYYTYPSDFWGIAGSPKVSNGILFFAGRGIAGGTELWKSDGTDAGTTMIKDITPGPNGTFISDLISKDNKLYFFAKEYSQLWVSDGSEANTIMVKDFEKGFLTADFHINPFLHKNSIYFKHLDENNKIILWKTDGTREGTIPLPHIKFEFPDFWPYVIINDKVFMSINDPVVGGEPYALYNDSLHLVKDITRAGSYPFDLFNYNNKLYFQVEKSFSERELWQSDGTKQKTNPLKSISSFSDEWLKPAPRTFFFKPLNNLLYFFAEDEQHPAGLWQTDGTPENTAYVTEVALPYYTDIRSHSLSYGIAKNNLIFNSGYPEEQTYKSNGTAQGTSVIINALSQFAEFGDKVYFLTSNSLLQTTDLANFTTVSQGIISNYHFSENANLLFSTGNQLFVKINKNELWILNNGNLELIKTFDTNTEIKELTFFDNKLFFSASSGNSTAQNQELWVSDGTTAGTQIFKEINVSTQKGSSPSHLKVINDKLYLVANDGINGNEVWISNGQSNGTTLLKNINIAAADAITNFSPSFTLFENEVYFTALSLENGIELWKTDGTNENTKLVVDLNTGIGSSSPKELIVSNGNLLFSATNGISGRNIWIYNPECKFIRIMESPLSDLINVTADFEGKSNGGKINASNKILVNSKVNITATSILLSPGFQVEQGSVFTAKTGGCN